MCSSTLIRENEYKTPSALDISKLFPKTPSIYNMKSLVFLCGVLVVVLLAGEATARCCGNCQNDDYDDCDTEDDDDADNTYDCGDNEDEEADPEEEEDADPEEEEDADPEEEDADTCTGKSAADAYVDGKKAAYAVKTQATKDGTYGKSAGSTCEGKAKGSSSSQY